MELRSRQQASLFLAQISCRSEVGRESLRQYRTQPLVKVMNVKVFFRSKVIRTTWFWLGLVCILLAAAAVLWVVFDPTRSRTGREWYLFLGLFSVITFWFRSMLEYNQIQSLELDWPNIDVSSPLYAVLQVCADQIARSCYGYAGIAVIVVAGAIR